jgi:hypothetical protein
VGPVCRSRLSVAPRCPRRRCFPPGRPSQSMGSARSPSIHHEEEGSPGDLPNLEDAGVDVDVQSWNRRLRAYTEMLKSGLPSEIAKGLRDMYRLKFDKDLSLGERRLLDQARSLLVQELALAKKVKPIEGEIQQILST